MATPQQMPPPSSFVQWPQQGRRPIVSTPTGYAAAANANANGSVATPINNDYARQMPMSAVQLGPGQQVPPTAARQMAQQPQHVHAQRRHMPQQTQAAPIGAVTTAPPFAPEDGLLLAGGVHNRLYLALISGLPNEVDWAFNKLVRLSAVVPQQNYRFESNIFPAIEAVIAHAEPFFERLKLNTAPDNFETTLENDSWTFCGPGGGHSASTGLGKKKDFAMPVFSEATVFNTADTAEQCERVLQVFHIVRNLVLNESCAVAVRSNSFILTFLAKAIALPSFSFFIVIKQQALDIFEMISITLTLRGRNDFYLACLRKILMQENDRCLIIGSLRTLIRLFSQEANANCVTGFESEIIGRCFQLMIVPQDEELVYLALDLIYTMTNLSADLAARIASAAPTNIVKAMLSVLHNRATETSSLQQTHQQQQQQQKQSSQKLQASASAAVELPFTKMGVVENIVRVPFASSELAKSNEWVLHWLREFYEPAAGHVVAVTDVLNDLHHWCQKNSYKPPHADITFAFTLKAWARSGVSSDSAGSIFKGLARKGQPPTSLINSRIGSPMSSTGAGTVSAVFDLDGGGMSSAEAVADSLMNLEDATGILGMPPLGMSGDAAAGGSAMNLSPPTLNVGGFPTAGPTGHPMSSSSAFPPGAVGSAPLASSGGASHPLQTSQYAGGVSSLRKRGRLSKRSQGTPVQTNRGGYPLMNSQTDETPEDVIEEVLEIIPCRWRVDSALYGRSECGEQFGYEYQLADHIQSTHFGGGSRHLCRWASCTALDDLNPATLSRGRLMAHLRTHWGPEVPQPVGQKRKRLPAPPLPSDHSHELAGCTLTALLILRNVARSPKNRDLFLPYEKDLTDALTHNRKISKFVAEIMALLD